MKTNQSTTERARNLKVGDAVWYHGSITRVAHIGWRCEAAGDPERVDVQLRYANGDSAVHGCLPDAIWMLATEPGMALPYSDVPGRTLASISEQHPGYLLEWTTQAGDRREYFPPAATRPEHLIAWAAHPRNGYLPRAEWATIWEVTDATIGCRRMRRVAHVQPGTTDWIQVREIGGAA